MQTARDVPRIVLVQKWENPIPPPKVRGRYPCGKDVFGLRRWPHKRYPAKAGCLGAWGRRELRGSRSCWFEMLDVFPLHFSSHLKKLPSLGVPCRSEIDDDVQLVLRGLFARLTSHSQKDLAKLCMCYSGPRTSGFQPVYLVADSLLTVNP